MKWKLPKSRSIYPVMWEEVENLLAKISVRDLYRHPIEKKELNKSLFAAAENFKAWVSEVIDLREFSFAYPTCGVTEAINNWLLSEIRPVQMFAGDYAWPSLVKKDLEKIQSPDEMRPEAVLYFSNPHSASGNFDPRWTEVLARAPAIILDCAFVGSTAKKRIPLDHNVEQVFFSFSKGFGVSRLRAGWKFSRTADPLYEQLTSLGYYHGLIPEISNLVTTHFPVDHFYKQAVAAQKQICQELDLEPSDSYLTGYSLQERYPFFLREDQKTERLSLAAFYYQMGLSKLAQQNAFSPEVSSAE